MDCPKCTITNDASRKFCRLCGAPLGMYCERCKTINGVEDKYCGTCGSALLLSIVDDVLIGGLDQNTVPQYKPHEIEELLTLRKKIKMSKETTQTYSQDDLDHLFSKEDK